MYLIQIIAIAIWAFVSVCAFFKFKQTVLIWMVARVLLNAQIAVRYNSPGMSTVIAIDMTLILIFFLRHLNKNAEKKEKLRLNKFPLATAFWITLVSFVISTLFAITPLSAGLVATLKYFISNFGIIFILYKCLNTKEDITLYVKTAFIIAIMITCLGVFEVVFKDNPWLDFVYLNSPQNEMTKGRMYYTPPFIGNGLQTRLGMVRAYSFMGIHIAFGTVCVYLLYMFTAIKKYRLHKYNTTLLNIVILLLLAGALASNSKTPIVGILVLLFAFYHFKDIVHPKVILPLIIIFILIIVCVPSITMNFMSLFDKELAQEAGGSSVAGRQVQFGIALKLFEMNPLLGNGIGSINAMRHIGNNDLILGAESSLMQILPERGLLGLAAYIVTYWSLFKYGRRFLPFKMSFFYLAALSVMELATGILDMPLWIGVYFCIVRMFQIKRLELTNQQCNYQHGKY